MQLTENLPEILESNNNNFQISASAIDASVKIFGMRVDSVYQETFKLQSGLNRTDASGLGEEERMEAAPVDAAPEQRPAPVKRHASRLNSTLVKNESEIDTTGFDNNYEEDPLVRKVSSAFDTGGAKGLLLNQLSVYQGCTIVFDSGDAPEEAGRKYDDEDSAAVLEDVSDLKDCFGKMLARLEELEICPEITNYKLEGVRVRNDDGIAAQLEQMAPTQMQSWSPLPSQQPSQSQAASQSVPVVASLAPSSFDNDIGGAFDDYGDDDDLDDHPRDFDADGNIVPSPVAPSGEGAVRLVPAAPGQARQQVTAQSYRQEGQVTDDLIKALLAGADDKGYYKPKSVNWTGPDNWNFKVGPQMTRVEEKKQKTDADGAGATSTTASKKKKGADAQYFIDFTVPAGKDWEAAFAPPKRGGTKLTKGTKEKAKTATTLLPADVHYGPNMLMSLFTKPKWMIPKQMLNWKPIIDPSATGQTVLAGVTAVPVADDMQPVGAADWFENVRADANDGAAGGDGVFSQQQQQVIDDDYDNGAYEGFGGDDDDDAGVVPASQADIEFMKPTITELGGVERTNLVNVPKHVEEINLAYARVARAVDVKTLKASIWKVMATNVPAGVSPGARRTSAMPSAPQNFQDMLEELPKKVPRFEQSNVSVPYCFISLLHLANERGLELQSNGLNDLRILPKAM